ncbi:hypothetical protein NDU88_007157 [Pleurodeles waltl]|uniref:Uncharacterized protein n=1 Tax=Pleurodeles waltl TaxID=8319 RepID=A0AAV7LSI4_PLEWA|nr:hypothetical protein NDU88_007157 [Pleurodeles waltl]
MVIAASGLRGGWKSPSCSALRGCFPWGSPVVSDVRTTHLCLALQAPLAAAMRPERGVMAHSEFPAVTPWREDVIYAHAFSASSKRKRGERVFTRGLKKNRVRGPCTGHVSWTRAVHGEGLQGAWEEALTPGWP